VHDRRRESRPVAVLSDTRPYMQAVRRRERRDSTPRPPAWHAGLADPRWAGRRGFRPWAGVSGPYRRGDSRACAGGCGV